MRKSRQDSLENNLYNSRIMKHNKKHEQDSVEIKSLSSIGSHKERKYDSIPFRIDFIKDLLGGKELQPMINFDSTETENFTGSIHSKPYNCSDCSDCSKCSDESNCRCKKNRYNMSDSETYDTKYILNKKNYDFYSIINEIGGKLMYIKSGTSGHTFKGIVDVDENISINYAVKVVAYPKKVKYGPANDVRRPENAELMMIKLLGYFVVKKQSPHIVLPIATFDTNIKPFTELIDTKVVTENNRKYLEFVERYKKGEYFDNVSILISEWANRGDLLDFIRKNYMQFTLLHWQVFFFQIISVLAVIQNKYPGFRHNDMKANNLLVHKVKPRGTSFSYTVNKQKYIVPNIGYQIKLWDFDFACIPGIVENKKVDAKWTNNINVKPEQNRYYDIHYFFNTLIKKGFFPQFMTEDCIPDEAKEFVNRIVPIKFRSGKYVTDSGRILINTEFKTPDEILKNDIFFEKFRNNFYKKKSNKLKHENRNEIRNPYRKRS